MDWLREGNFWNAQIKLLQLVVSKTVNEQVIGQAYSKLLFETRNRGSTTGYNLWNPDVYLPPLWDPTCISTPRCKISMSKISARK